MKTRSFTLAAGALALGLATLAPITAQAQPLWDRVDVNLPYSVTIGDRTLQPGQYVIQQLSSESGGGQVLLIYGDNGMKFKTSAMTIPALENRTQPDTRVILHHIGDNYYFDKVWIQGKDYGYEFPLPSNVKMRENEAAQPAAVAATSSTVTQQPTVTDQTTTEQTTTQQNVATEQSNNQGVTQPPVTPQPVTQPPVTQQETVEQPPAQPVTPPVTAQPDTTLQDSANRSAETTPEPAPAMPETSAGWLMMLLSGGALSGVGATLRSKLNRSRQ